MFSSSPFISQNFKNNLNSNNKSLLSSLLIIYYLISMNSWNFSSKIKLIFLNLLMNLSSLYVRNYKNLIKLQALLKIYLIMKLLYPYSISGLKISNYSSLIDIHLILINLNLIKIIASLSWQIELIDVSKMKIGRIKRILAIKYSIIAKTAKILFQFYLNL